MFVLFSLYIFSRSNCGVTGPEPQTHLDQLSCVNVSNNVQTREIGILLNLTVRFIWSLEPPGELKSIGETQIFNVKLLYLKLLLVLITRSGPVQIIQLSVKTS